MQFLFSFSEFIPAKHKTQKVSVAQKKKKKKKPEEEVRYSRQSREADQITKFAPVVNLLVPNKYTLR